MDNPYVTVTTWRRKISIFNIGGVPPGKHTVEVWHPVYQPVRRTFQIEVEANKIKEVLIEFYPPVVPAGEAKPAPNEKGG